MIIKFYGNVFYITELTKSKVAELINKPVEAIVEAIRFIYNGYPVTEETVIPKDATVHCVLQLI